MDEVPQDAYVPSTCPNHVQEHAQPARPLVPVVLRARSTIGMPSLSALFALFVQQVQQGDIPVDPSHIYIGW
jgi:hypothetical protein